MSELIVEGGAAVDQPMTAMDAIRTRYPAPEWVVMGEVAPSTGGGTRYADAIAVNTWRSRGYAVIGFEVKMRRSDWLRELKQPEKADAMIKNCDCWYLVAPKGVIGPGELPPNWGHLELRANGLRVAVEAPRLEPAPMSRAFFASLMRRGYEQIGAVAERMQRDAVNRARADVQAQVEQGIKAATAHHARLQAAVDEFTEKTGLQIRPYVGPPIDTIRMAKLLEPLHKYGNQGALSMLADLASQLEFAAKITRDAIANTGVTGEN